MKVATLTEIMDLVDANAKAYYMGRGEDTRKQVQAAIAGALNAEPRDPEWRTDREIVEQTEKLARLLMREVHGREPENVATTCRDSEHPRAKWCWGLACRIQEMLTATDVSNSVAALEGPSL